MPWRDRALTLARSRGPEALACLAALVIGGAATEATDVVGSSYADTNDLLGLAAALVLWWRRRAPVTVAAAAFVAAAASPLASGAAIVAVFNLAEQRPGRVPLWLAGLYVASAVVSTLTFPDEALGTVGSLLAGAVLTAAAVGWGLVLRSRRDLVASLADRAKRAEREQQARVAEARTAERNRLAAEMHDVLAHRLSMLSLHAGAIEHRPDAPPEDLARSAAVVRASAHLALEELRDVLGVLRAGDTVAPAPGAGDIDDLVRECVAAGMHVELTVPDLDAVPPALGRHLYRIVQEALTNARKHAPGRRVRVSLEARPGEGVAVVVVNDMPAPTEPTVPGAGVGLVGLRERVRLAGGTLEAEADAPGGHRLRAWLPWPA